MLRSQGYNVNIFKVSNALSARFTQGPNYLSSTLNTETHNSDPQHPCSAATLEITKLVWNSVSFNRQARCSTA